MRKIKAVTLTCNNDKCGKKFERVKSEVDRSKKRGLIKTYCSHSCASIVNGRLFPKRKRVNGKTKCLNCTNIISRKNRLYCSQECSNTHKRDAYISDWKSGKNNGTIGNGKYKTVSSRIRNYLLETAKYKCPECGWGKMNPATEKIPLEIDHIDGDWTNNVPENLRVLCPNCHALTPTYKGANRGNSPEYRAKGKRAGGK